MVSPHSDWQDEENGYVNGSAAIFVKPVIQNRMSTAIPEDEEDANAHAVEIRTGYGSCPGRHDYAAVCEDPVVAWEYANLLTHYFSERLDRVPDEMVVKNEIVTSREEGIDDSESLPFLIEEMTAEEAFVQQTDSFKRPAAVEELLDDDILE